MQKEKKNLNWQLILNVRKVQVSVVERIILPAQVSHLLQQVFCVRKIRPGIFQINKFN